MPNLMFLCKHGIWPIFCQLMAILAILLDMDFKFVLPRIYINFHIHTNFEVKKCKPKIQKNRAQIFFGGLNKKSAMISMCKFHIYIDSERFRKIY